MTPTTTTPVRSKHITFYFIGNLCIAFLMLFALPVIHNGQKGFLPYTEIDKEYVNNVIGSGEAEYMNKALKTTESARAMAYDSQVSTMSLMRYAVVGLAALFLLNSFLLYRLRLAPSRPATSA